MTTPSSPVDHLAVERRCGIGESFDDWCPSVAIYAAEWDNGDRMDVCEEHAATVRAVSVDLTKISTLPPGNQPGEPS